jgi:hypothetical protein
MVGTPNRFSLPPEVGVSGGSFRISPEITNGTNNFSQLYTELSSTPISQRLLSVANCSLKSF